MAPKIMITAAVREAENVHLLRQSGADSVVVSAETAGRLLGMATTTPAVVSVVEDLISPEAGMSIGERVVDESEIGGSPRHLRDIVLGVVRDGQVHAIDAPEVDARGPTSADGRSAVDREQTARAVGLVRAQARHDLLDRGTAPRPQAGRVAQLAGDDVDDVAPAVVPPHGDERQRALGRGVARDRPPRFARQRPVGAVGWVGAVTGRRHGGGHGVHARGGAGAGVRVARVGNGHRATSSLPSPPR
jgi:hypothetical protein